MAATRTSSSFITSVALVAVCCCCCCCCSAAAVATPPDLSCDHRLLDNGSLVLQLKGTSSGSLDLLFSSWADENDTKFVEGAQFDSDKVLSVNNNSATLRKCQNQVLFTYMGQNLLMVRCNVTCPPEGQPVETWNVGVPVTISVAAVLILFSLMVVFMKWKLFCVREHLQAPGRAEVL